jgi:hypothetical protein
VRADLQIPKREMHDHRRMKSALLVRFSNTEKWYRQRYFHWTAQPDDIFLLYVCGRVCLHVIL